MLGDYLLKSELSAALYGSIWLANDKMDVNKYAIKQMNLSAMQKVFSFVEQVSTEEDGFLERQVNRLIASSLPRSESIVKLITDFEENGYMHLVFEYCPQGDLFNIVKQKGKLCPAQVLKYFRNIVIGVRDLHHIGYAHRDLSLENILIDNEGRAKICDFGLVAKANTLTNVAVGKSFYMAPEVQAGEVYTPKLADSWSLGIILVILLTGIPPFEEASTADPRFLIVKTKGIRALFRSWNIEQTVSPSAIDLLSNLLAFNPHDRLDMTEILNHPWVCGCDLNDSRTKSQAHRLDLKSTNSELFCLDTYFTSMFQEIPSRKKKQIQRYITNASA